MPEPQTMLLKTNLKHLRLPTMGAEFAKLAREASAANEDYEQYLLRLTELEVAARSANALKARIQQALFPVLKDLDTYDFSLLPGLSKQKILELARGEWIDQHFNCCLIGNAGTGKTHLAIALGLAADQFGIQQALGAARFDGLLHSGLGMLGKKLQHADVLPAAGMGAVAVFQGRPQVGECEGQLPVAIHPAVVQGSGPTAQRHQVVHGVQDLLTAAVRTGMPGDDLMMGDDLDAIRVGLDGDGLESPASRHAVTVGVEDDGLVLVCLLGLPDAGIEGMDR
jgi:hypothetical protein